MVYKPTNKTGGHHLLSGFPGWKSGNPEGNRSVLNQDEPAAKSPLCPYKFHINVLNSTMNQHYYP